MSEESPEIAGSEDFKQKFSSQTFEAPNGKLEYCDINPINIRPGGEVPIISMIGWAMGQEVVGNVTNELYRLGQRVVPIEVIGQGEVVKIENTTSSEINRQAEILKSFIESRKEPKLNLLGQSLSSLAMLSLVKNHPEIAERINSVILVSPMGISGKDNIFSLAKRQITEVLRANKRNKSEEEVEIDKRVVDSMKGFIPKNLKRAFNEIMGMANADEYEVLKLLKEKGIKVGIIQGFDDKLADKDRLFAKMGEGYESPFKPVDPQNAKPQQKFEYTPSDKPPPPMDSLRQTMGGHEIMGPKKFAGTILRTLDRLNHPITEEQAIASSKKGQETTS